MLLGLLHKAFIAPFSSLERSILYLCAFLGQFGSFGALLYLAFDFTGSDLSIVIAFYVGKFLFANLILLPFFFMLLKRHIGPAFFFSCVCMQIFILCLLYIHPELLTATTWNQGLVAGLLIALVSSPFWTIFHNLMLHFTTTDNRGHEVSIAELGLKVGVVTASMMSGLMLTFLPGIFFPLASLACITVGTITLALVTLDFTGQEVDRSTPMMQPYRDIFRRKLLNTATLFQGAVTSLIEFFVPIWMKFFGFSAIITGGVLIAQIAVRTFISPITGALFERKDGSELRLGSIFFILGWLPWLFISHIGLLLYSFINWAVSSHTINVGMDSRWYDEQTLEGMATREIMLGIGRFLCAIIIMPLLVVSPHMFIISCIALALVFIGISFFLKKRQDTNA